MSTRITGVHDAHDESVWWQTDSSIPGVLQHCSEFGRRVLSAARLTDATHAQHPALAHVGGTVRLQVVKEGSGQLHQFLVTDDSSTGREALIDTSVNDRDNSIEETLVLARDCPAVIPLAQRVVEDVHA